MKNPSAPADSVRLTNSRFASVINVCLLLCLFIGLACRFVGLNWDEGTQIHPDERFCLSVVEKLSFPTSMAQFFDSNHSPLSPTVALDAHYVYGQLPLFILKIAAQVTKTTDPHTLSLLGRFLAALFDCGTVFWTFLIARRIFDAQKALFCAALVACAALHIQQSHFFVVDPFSAFFLTASFWAGARLSETNRARDAMATGAFFGAALACKISSGLFLVALLGFLIVFARQFGARRAVLGTLLVTISALLVFRVAHPMAFRGEFGFFDWRPDLRFWSDLKHQGDITRGEVDVPFNVQWIGRPPLWYSLQNLGFWGYGWPFLLSAGVGIAFLVRRPSGKALLIIAAFFAFTLLGVQGAAFSKFTRYFLPLTPFCALLAAHCWSEIERKKPVFRLGVPLVALSAAAWALAVTSIYTRTHTRVAASRWIVENVPAGAAIANESAWDDGLPLGQLGLPQSFRWTDLDLHAPDSTFKNAELESKLDAVEWIFVSSGRGWQNIPRWSEKWPVTTEYYRALFDGRLGFRLEKRFASFPQLLGWQFPDGNAEEALTVYDHPLVFVFHKTEDYNSQNVRQILENVALPAPRNWHPNLAPRPDESALPRPPGF